MPKPDETFIVRVRRSERDAIVEQPGSSRRRRIPDVSGVGELIRRWLGEPDGTTEIGAAPAHDRSQISEVGRESTDRKEQP